jgi:hypothetical protein
MRTGQHTALVVLVVVEAAISTFSVLLVLRHAMVHRSLPMVFGAFRALSGPFEALGMDAFIVSGLVFVALSGLKFLSAYWLWNLRPDGAVLQLILLGLSSVFWYGFAVPYGPLLGVPQLILIALLWKTFHI